MIRKPIPAPSTGCRDWPNSQFQASFKGIPFEVDADTRQVGRRIVVHQYPKSEHWDNEDMGRLAQTVPVEGYVYGDDADSWAERLMAACSSPKAGLLVLPNRPPMMARPLRCDTTWVGDEMGRIPVQMEFVLESGSTGGLVPLVMLTGAVVRAVGDAMTLMEEVFGRRFNTLMRRFSRLSHVPAVARDAAAAAIMAAADALAAAVKAVQVPDNAAAVAIDFELRRIRDNAVLFSYHGQRGDRFEPDAFVRDQVRAKAGGGFAPAWNAVIRRVLSDASDKPEVATAGAALAAFETPATTPGPECLSVRAERALVEEVAQFVRLTGVLMQAQALAMGTYGSHPEAVSARAAVGRAFARVMDGIDDPALASALTLARNKAVDLLTKSGAELPQVIEVDLRIVKPAAVIATMLYADASKDAELVARNRVSHPNFMPPLIEALRP